MQIVSRLTALAIAALGTILFLLAVNTTAFASDNPAGFWYGADSSAPTATGSTPPYAEPWVSCCANFGGYVAEVGQWFNLCNGSTDHADNQTDWQDANANVTSGVGSLGTMLYYFMGGPGADPNYNGTSAEATNWGQAQAQNAWSRYQSENVAEGLAYSTPLMFMDIESNGNDNGWRDVLGGCGSGNDSGLFMPDLARATFNGFWNYIQYSTPLLPGVYSSDYLWQRYFGTGSDSQIPNTWESSSEFESSSVAGPGGWCEGSTCAQFFGGQNAGSSHALAWQWSTGSAGNPYGDFDQFDGSRVLNNAPAANALGAATPPGQQTAFWRGTNADLFEDYYANGSWNNIDVTVSYFASQWNSSMALASGPSATASTSQQDSFWRGGNGDLWEAWYAGAWYGPADITSGSLGGMDPPATGPGSSFTPSGQQDVFWGGPANHMFEAWYSGRWYGPLDLTASLGWTSASDPASRPAVTANSSQQEAFWRASNGDIWEAWYVNSTGQWFGPSDLTSTVWGGVGGGGTTPPTAAFDSTGQQDVFWDDSGGNLWEAWYSNGWHGPVNLTANWSGTSGWTSNAYLTTGPALECPSGQQAVFWRGSDGLLWEAWYVGSTGTWNGPLDLNFGQMG